MKTLLQNLKSQIENYTTVAAVVQHFGIGQETIDQFVALNRFPFVIVDRADGIGEEYVRPNAHGLKLRRFHVTVKLAVRSRKQGTALLGDDGLLLIFDKVMDAIYSDETVGGRVDKLEEEMIVREMEILAGDAFIGLGRQIDLTYVVEESA